MANLLRSVSLSLCPFTLRLTASSESRELSGSIFANFTRWHVTKGRSRGGGTVIILPIERPARSSLAVPVAIRESKEPESEAPKSSREETERNGETKR